MRLTEKRDGPSVVKAVPKPKKLAVSQGPKRPVVAVRQTEKRGNNP
ncbi:MAG TPA: hypothetical protein VH062_02240 [Polyangiaceae bacterium]|jgi:hypothetical protein|nr:hypothetical protein [Polyangiaceae bacterium]